MIASTIRIVGTITAGHQLRILTITDGKRRTTATIASGLSERQKNKRNIGHGGMVIAATIVITTMITTSTESNRESQSAPP